MTQDSHPSPEPNDLAIPVLVVAVLAVVVAVIGLGILPSIRFVLGSLCIGIGIGCWQNWRRLRHARRPPTGWPTTPARVTALASAFSGVFVVLLPILRGRFDLADGGIAPSLRLLFLGACAGYGSGYWLDWAQARSTLGSDRASSPAVPRAATVLATGGTMILLVLPMIVPWILDRVDPPAPAAPPGPSWCPQDARTAPKPGSRQLLVHPLAIGGAPPNPADECYQGVDPHALSGQSTLHLVYDLHGLTAMRGDASAIIFHQGSNNDCTNAPGCVWHYISLSDYGQNGKNGTQDVPIPLSAFPGLNLDQPLDGIFHIRFWSPTTYRVDIIGMYAT